jgi:hypothetical protein
MGNRVILENEEFPITPADIKHRQRFFGAFDNTEMEESAGYIVALMQKLGSWIPFTLEQVNELYEQLSGKRKFSWNRLLGYYVIDPKEWWPQKGKNVPSDVFIAEGSDGKFYVTDAFILACYRSAPILRLKKAAKR